jgi:hypothetical protein
MSSRTCRHYTLYIHDVLTSEDIFLHVFRAKLSFRALFPITFYRESLSRDDNFPSPSLCCSREISFPELGLLSSFYITSSFSWIQTSCWLHHKHRINTTHQLQQSQHHRGGRQRERKVPPPLHILVERVNLACVWYSNSCTFPWQLWK